MLLRILRRMEMVRLHKATMDACEFMLTIICKVTMVAVREIKV